MQQCVGPPAPLQSLNQLVEFWSSSRPNRSGRSRARIGHSDSIIRKTCTSASISWPCDTIWNSLWRWPSINAGQFLHSVLNQRSRPRQIISRAWPFCQQSRPCCSCVRSPWSAHRSFIRPWMQTCFIQRGTSSLCSEEGCQWLGTMCFKSLLTVGPKGSLALQAVRWDKSVQFVLLLRQQDFSSLTKEQLMPSVGGLLKRLDGVPGKAIYMSCAKAYGLWYLMYLLLNMLQFLMLSSSLFSDKETWLELKTYRSKGSRYHWCFRICQTRFWPNWASMHRVLHIRRTSSCTKL